jgi:hypothetical protein
MTRISNYYKVSIEVGIESTSTGLDLATQKFRTGKNHNCKVIDDLPLEHVNLSIFKYLRFPIVHLTKKDMLKIINKHKWNKLIQNTWSCWYPYLGLPCNKCDMCNHRIINIIKNK